MPFIKESVLYPLPASEIKYLSWIDLSRELTQLKKDSWLSEAPSVPQIQALRNLDKAFQNFFKIKGRGYPKFKSRYSVQSIIFSGKGTFHYKDGEIYLPKLKVPLRIKWSRYFTGQPRTITVSKDKINRYFISILVNENMEYMPKTLKEVGIDLGLATFVTTSEGFKFYKPKHLYELEARKKLLNKRLSRKKLRSKNREKARFQLAKIEAEIADKRKDFLHKLSTRFIKKYDIIYMENLRVQNMVKNHCLAKSITDAGWGIFKEMLKYKAEIYGKKIVEIDTFYPSTKLCLDCGFKNDNLSLNDRDWICPKCGVVHNRDINAARNILEVGRTLIACGETVIPDGKSLSEGSFLRSRNMLKPCIDAEHRKAGCSHAGIQA